MTLNKRLAVGMLGAIMVVGATAAFSASGYAVVRTVANKCTANGTSTISPGLTTTPTAQTITVSGALNPCSKPRAHSLTATFSGTFTSKHTDCNPATANAAARGTLNIAWSNGRASTVTATFNQTPTATNPVLITVKGTVTSGLYVGNSMTGKVSYIPDAGQDCQNVPVTSATFTTSPTGLGGEKPFVFSHL